MPFGQCFWLEDFVVKRVLSQLKNTLNSCHENQSASCDQALDKLSEKLNSRLLVQEEHGFQKGAQCAPLAAGAKKLSLAWIGLSDTRRAVRLNDRNKQQTNPAR